MKSAKKLRQTAAFCGIVILLFLALPEATLAEVAKAAKQKVVATYGKLPLSFEANQGQTDGQVKFLSRGSGYSLFLTSTEAVLALSNPEEKPSAVSDQLSAKSLKTHDSKLQTVLRMKLVGTDSASRITGLEELPGKSQYFIGNDPAKWRTNVPSYAKVKYEDVYPGVDLIYYGNQRQLEYDFVVSPGADPSAIKLAFEGAEKMEIDAQGDLLLQTATGDLRLKKPLVYQEIDGIRREISAAYVLNSNPKSKIENRSTEARDRSPKSQSVGFQLAAYDISRPLIIDPVLSYSTFLGGSSDRDEGLGIAVDSSGNAYVTGVTASTNFPTTAGAFDNSFNGSGGFCRTECGGDVFVTKLNATGSALVYSTYVGGSGVDQGHGIAVDSAGNAYVTGITTSAVDFPTTAGAFDVTSNGGNTDAFVIKLNPTGSTLVYSTLLGGRDFEFAAGIAVDTAGNAYVTGFTGSTDFPTTAGAFDVTFSVGFGGFGGLDAFVTKLNPMGSALVYSTFLGGSREDRAAGIAVDTAGNAYVTGQTISPNFPTTAGAFDVTFIVGSGSFEDLDAFVTKLNPTGSALVYSTYLGGSSFDVAAGIAVDTSGNAYVTGGTGSTDFPTTTGAFQTGGGDIFVTKLNPTGSALVYSTYLGGSNRDGVRAIAVDSSGNAYVTGFTTSTDFPTTPGAFDQTLDGGTDAFVTKLNPTGSVLVYSTLLGGSLVDFAAGIAVDASGNAYVTGSTTSTDFSTTAGAFDETFNGGSNEAFVTKFSFAVPFDAFDAKVEIEPDEGEFEVKATFTLGAASDGIDPLTEDVTLQIGTFSTTIPAGSFDLDDGSFKFEGVIGGVNLEFKIIPLGGNSFEFKAEGEGANLTGIVNPVQVTLTIGDDSGTTTVTAEFEG